MAGWTHYPALARQGHIAFCVEYPENVEIILQLVPQREYEEVRWFEKSTRLDVWWFVLAILSGRQRGIDMP